MLPAESHATSVGRLNCSPLAPAPGSGPPAPGTGPAPAAAAGGWGGRGGTRADGHRQRRHAHRLRLAAQHHLDPPVRVELDHLRRHLVDDPDVVLAIDAHLLRLQEAVRPLTDLTDERARAIELEQPRPAVRD